MKCVKATAIFLLIWLVTAASNADELYIWTDKGGEQHITQEPPPQGAQSNSIVEYTPEPAKEVKQYEQRQQLELENYRLEQRRQEALAARRQADEARREAQQARIEADVVARQSQAYIDTHDRNQYMRRAYRYGRRKAAEEADAARQKAMAAEKRAVAAEEKAQSAEQRLRQALQESREMDQDRAQ